MTTALTQARRLFTPDDLRSRTEGLFEGALRRIRVPSTSFPRSAIVVSVVSTHSFRTTPLKLWDGSVAPLPPSHPGWRSFALLPGSPVTAPLYLVRFPPLNTTPPGVVGKRETTATRRGSGTPRWIPGGEETPSRGLGRPPTPLRCTQPKVRGSIPLGEDG